MIRKSIAEYMRSELPANFLSTEPVQMLSTISAHFAQSSDSVHRRLETDAQNLKLKPVKSMDDYLAIHRSLRRYVHQASFPRIDYEVTTLHFVVNVLSGHPHY